jgi:hypothetical protein
MLADYRCECGKITEYKKPYGQENFPEFVECECGKKAKRIYNTPIIVPDDFKSVRGK